MYNLFLKTLQAHKTYPQDVTGLSMEDIDDHWYIYIHTKDKKIQLARFDTRRKAQNFYTNLKHWTKDILE